MEESDGGSNPSGDGSGGNCTARMVAEARRTMGFWELLGRNTGEKFEVNSGEIKISPGPRFRTAMLVAIAADVLEMIVFPLFVEGFESPVEDLLDIGVGAVLSYLLGWHWEFAPSFLAKLVPGVDLIPLWTMAVANVYRKSRPPGPVTIEGTRMERQAEAVHPEQTRGS